MTGPVLVTGGTGTTGSRVAALLQQRGVSVRIASRRPTAGQVRFDWADPGTHRDALDGVRAVYLVAPVGEVDPAPLVEPFLATARGLGVQRVVLLSAAAAPEGSPVLGELHRMVRATSRNRRCCGRRGSCRPSSTTTRSQPRSATTGRS